MNTLKTLIVMPAKNEAATIATVIADIRRGYLFDILVVDDGSQDNTGTIARQAGARVLTHVQSLGAWKATQTGIRYGRKQGYEQVITLDADGQHIAAEIQTLLVAAQAGADVVVGSCLSRGNFLRHMAWQSFRGISGISVKDITSGFRLYGLPAMRVLSSKEATLLEFQDLGVLLLLRSLGLQIKEVDVTMALRSDGKSRIFSSWFKVVSYMITTALVCLTKAIPLTDVRYLKRFEDK